MMKLIFTGMDKTFFNSLTFNNNVNACWLSIEELMHSGTTVESSNIKLVVFYSTPELFLSTLGDQSLSNLEQANEQWLPQTEFLTQLYLTNKKNAILVDSEQCEFNFDEFRTLLHTKLDVESEPFITRKELKNDGVKLLTQSHQLTLITTLNDNYEIQNMYENVMSAADLLVVSDDYSPEFRSCAKYEMCQKLVDGITIKYSEHSDFLKENELLQLQVQELQKGLDSTSNQQKTSEAQLKLNEAALEKNANEISILKNNITELTSDNQTSLSQLQKLQAELEASSNKQKVTEEQLQLKKSDVDNAINEISILKNNITELTSDNQSSLSQLQKELENSYQEQKRTQDKLTKNKSLLDKVTDEASKVNIINSQLIQSKSKFENNIAQLKSENELSLLQVQQLQEELENSYQEQKRTQDKLTKNKSLLDKVTDEASKAKKINSQLIQSKSKFENNIAQLKSENELSLLQVQQLQEELEMLYQHQVMTEKKLALNIEASDKVATEMSVIQKSYNQQAELVAENEIALLQIQQLQEELEFYFAKYQSLNTNSIVSSICSIKVDHKKFENSLTLKRLLNA